VLFRSPTKQVEDYIALAKLFEDLGLHEHATKLYLHALSQNHTHSGYTDTLNRLALIYKRQENYNQAIQLWELAAKSKSILAHIELAKYYEHRIHDYEKAIYWTEAALNQVQSQIYQKFEKKQWIDEIEHRLKRLIRLNS
jgi:tetratricopeptide (TPR) repeat protein